MSKTRGIYTNEIITSVSLIEFNTHLSSSSSSYQLYYNNLKINECYKINEI